MNTIFDETIAIDYTKSAFSIAADNLPLKLMGAVLVMFLMFGWVIWFFFAQLTFYETSQATMQPDGVVMAEFGASSITRLKYEQPAFFLSKNSSGQATSVPLRIADIDTKSRKVQLWPAGYQDAKNKNTLVQRSQKQLMVGQVKIGVEQVTPATLILRAAGLTSSSTANSDQ